MLIENSSILTSHYICLFDDECTLCNSFVRFIYKRDKKKIFLFAGQSSLFAQKFFEEKNPKFLNTIYLIIPQGNYFIKSSAVIQILKRLNWKWKVLAFFLQFIPTALRNIFYDFIAHHRRKLFKQNCIIKKDALLQERILN